MSTESADSHYHWETMTADSKRHAGEIVKRALSHENEIFRNAAVRTYLEECFNVKSNSLAHMENDMRHFIQHFWSDLLDHVNASLAGKHFQHDVTRLVCSFLQEQAVRKASEPFDRYLGWLDQQSPAENMEDDVEETVQDAANTAHQALTSLVEPRDVDGKEA